MTTALRFVTALLLGLPLPLFAYSDPGSGALLLQLLMAGLVGLLFQIRKITSWFKNRRQEKQEH